MSDTDLVEKIANIVGRMKALGWNGEKIEIHASAAVAEYLDKVLPDDNIGSDWQLFVSTLIEDSLVEENEDLFISEIWIIPND